MDGTNATRRVTVLMGEEVDAITNLALCRLGDGRCAAFYQGMVFPLLEGDAIQLDGEWFTVDTALPLEPPVSRGGDEAPEIELAEGIEASYLLVDAGPAVTRLAAETLQRAGLRVGRVGEGVLEGAGGRWYAGLVRIEHGDRVAPAIAALTGALSRVDPADWAEAWAEDRRADEAAGRDDLLTLLHLSERRRIAATALLEETRNELDLSKAEAVTLRGELEIARPHGAPDVYREQLRVRIADLERQMVQFEITIAQREQDLLAAQSRIDELAAATLAASAAAPTPTIRQRGRLRLSEDRFEALVEVVLPRIRLLRDSASVATTAFSDIVPLMRALRRMCDDDWPSFAKPFRGARCYEMHVQTGRDDSGRLYFSRSSEGIEVLVSVKPDQSTDAHWLKQHFGRAP